MARLFRNLSAPLHPAPIRFRCSGTVGTPLLNVRVLYRACTWEVRSFKGINAVNGLFGGARPVTLTVSPCNQLAVTVTVPNRYGRAQ